MSRRRLRCIERLRRRASVERQGVDDRASANPHGDSYGLTGKRFQAGA